MLIARLKLQGQVALAALTLMAASSLAGCGLGGNRVNCKMVQDQRGAGRSDSDIASALGVSDSDVASCASGGGGGETYGGGEGGGAAGGGDQTPPAKPGM